MKKSFKENAGFTLIELIVSMAMAVIVTAAATSVLLMALRVNNQTSQTASQQITVQALLNVMEDAAADGKITSIQSDYVSWALVEGEGENARTIFSYDAESQTIFTNGTPVLEGVYASNAIMEGQLLSISIETKAGTYTSAIYCRMASPVADPDLEELPNDPSVVDANRNKFLEILKSQYRSRGEIRYNEEIPQQPDSPTYYSEWYIGGYEGNPGWNSRTPWCACYVSWALVQTGIPGPAGHGNWFANVDHFMAYFQKSGAWKEAAPEAGDLIFFDWNRGDNPQHVGVVMKVEGSIVYTIEGNSAGRVTIRSYSINDSRIIGYGVVFPT